MDPQDNRQQHRLRHDVFKLKVPSFSGEKPETV